MSEEMALALLRGGLRAALAARPKPHEVRAYLRMLEEHGLDSRREYEDALKEREVMGWPKAPTYEELFSEVPFDMSKPLRGEGAIENPHPPLRLVGVRVKRGFLRYPFFCIACLPPGSGQFAAPIVVDDSGQIRHMSMKGTDFEDAGIANTVANAGFRLLTSGAAPVSPGTICAVCRNRFRDLAGYGVDPSDVSRLRAIGSAREKFEQATKRGDPEAAERAREDAMSQIRASNREFEKRKKGRS